MRWDCGDLGAGRGSWLREQSQWETCRARGRCSRRARERGPGARRPASRGPARGEARGRRPPPVRRVAAPIVTGSLAPRTARQIARPSSGSSGVAGDWEERQREGVGRVGREPTRWKWGRVGHELAPACRMASAQKELGGVGWGDSARWEWRARAGTAGKSRNSPGGCRRRPPRGEPCRGAFLTRSRSGFCLPGYCPFRHYDSAPTT